jgi:hypothetical protein
MSQIKKLKYCIIAPYDPDCQKHVISFTIPAVKYSPNRGIQPALSMLGEFAMKRSNMKYRVAKDKESQRGC